MDLQKTIYKDYLRICPRCYEEFFPGLCEIVATLPEISKGEQIKPAPQGGLQRQLAIIHPEQLIGDVNSKRQARRKCPHCGYFLPPRIETMPTMNIVVVGDVGSGKSHYITSLIKEIESVYIQKLKKYVRFQCVTPYVLATYRLNYFNRLYTQHQVIPGTNALSRAAQQVASQPNQQAFSQPTFFIDPLIYELTITRPGGYLPSSLYLVIYDTSGEDYETAGNIAQFTRYVFKANGIIFLADPGTMPGIARHIDSAKLQISGSAQNYTHNASETLNVLASEIEIYKGVRPGIGKIDIPVAVTLSKSDLLEHNTHINGYSDLFTNPTYEYGLDLDDVDGIDQNIRDIIENFGDASLVNAVATFSESGFFAVSATGSPPTLPDPAGSPYSFYPNIKPVRCLDPLLWILHKLGHIPAKGDI